MFYRRKDVWPWALRTIVIVFYRHNYLKFRCIANCKLRFITANIINIKCCVFFIPPVYEVHMFIQPTSCNDEVKIRWPYSNVCLFCWFYNAYLPLNCKRVDVMPYVRIRLLIPNVHNSFTPVVLNFERLSWSSVPSGKGYCITGASCSSGAASSISGGVIFIYSCSGQLSSFEIKSISKELN